MIEARCDETRYRTPFTDGRHPALADVPAEKGGQGAGYRPHDLLEAALATCISMTLRMYADEHGIPLTDARTRVTLDRAQPDTATFEYEIELLGELSDGDRARLRAVARKCPVRRTLSRQIGFRESPA